METRFQPPKTDTQITGQRCAATVTWHPQPGGTQRVTAAGDTVEEALSKAWRAAIGVGYSRPKWWQYWRWSESEGSVSV